MKYIQVFITILQLCNTVLQTGIFVAKCIYAKVHGVVQKINQCTAVN